MSQIAENDLHECDGCHEHFDYKMRDDKGGICLPCRHCCDCGCCCDEDGEDSTEECMYFDSEGYTDCICGKCPIINQEEEPVQERMAGSIVTTTVSFKRWVADHPEVCVADHSTDTTDQNDS